MKRKELLKELNGLSVADLKNRVLELNEELMKLRFKRAANQVDRPHVAGEVRRTLARVKTVLSSKSVVIN